MTPVYPFIQHWSPLDRVIHLDSLPTMGPSIAALPDIFLRRLCKTLSTFRNTQQEELFNHFFHDFMSLKPFFNTFGHQAACLSVLPGEVSERFMFQYRFQEAGRWLLSTLWELMDFSIIQSEGRILRNLSLESLMLVELYQTCFEISINFSY